MFAVVDLETTGGYAENHQIIEIGIIILDYQGNNLEEYHWLVQPNRKLTPFITRLTGISDQDLEGKPEFQDIAQEVFQILSDKVFVAHNVNFDFGFLREEFSRVQIEFNPQKLCTVKYTRKVVKNLPSYSLKNLCNHFGLVNENPHRAIGDARVTAEILKILLAKDQTRNSYNSLIKKKSPTLKLPINLDPKLYNQLPLKPGVYFFLDLHNQPIYIGKALSLKQRVTTHFTGDIRKRKIQAFYREVYDIKYRETGTDLMAQLLEDHEIRKSWPKYNVSQKVNKKKFGLFVFQDQKKNFRLGINPVAKNLTGFHKTYLSYAEGMNDLMQIAREWELVPKLCGLLEGASSGNSISFHNTQVKKFLLSLENDVEEILELNGPDFSNKVFVWTLGNNPIGWTIQNAFPSHESAFEKLSGSSVSRYIVDKMKAEEGVRRYKKNPHDSVSWGWELYR